MTAQHWSQPSDREHYQTHTYTETYRETYRHTHRQMQRHIQRETDTTIQIHADRHIYTGGQTDRNQNNC